MAVRTLDQILSELGSTYNPQIDSIRARQNLIPGQVAEEEKGLQAKQEQAFGDILGGARRRGLGFSGIPLGEQARYTSTEFLPALARLKSQGREQAMNLEDAILGIQERRNTLAQQLRQAEIDREEGIRQKELDRQNELEKARFSSGGGSYSPGVGAYLGSGGNQSAPSQKAFYSLKDARNPNAGFAFKDINGKDISALQYSKLTGTPFNELVRRMAEAGDQGARQVSQFATKTGVAQVFNPQYANLVRAFTW